MTKCKDCKYLEKQYYRKRLKKERVLFCNRPEMKADKSTEFLIESDLDKECPYGY